MRVKMEQEAQVVMGSATEAMIVAGGTSHVGLSDRSLGTEATIAMSEVLERWRLGADVRLRKRLDGLSWSRRLHGVLMSGVRECWRRPSLGVMWGWSVRMDDTRISMRISMRIYMWTGGGYVISKSTYRDSDWTRILELRRSSKKSGTTRGSRVVLSTAVQCENKVRFHCHLVTLGSQLSTLSFTYLVSTPG